MDSQLQCSIQMVSNRYKGCVLICKAILCKSLMLSMINRLKISLNPFDTLRNRFCCSIDGKNVIDSPISSFVMVLTLDPSVLYNSIKNKIQNALENMLDCTY
eukprot:274434_1